MRFATFKQLTRLEQTFFGLPFILASVSLAFLTKSAPFSFQWSWLWILPAFMAARLSGMAFNQVIDRHIDKENRRTSKRVVASGILSSRLAYSIAFSFLGLFLLSCSQINQKIFYFSLLAALLLFCYSYTKRITAFCHLILGMIHFLATLMAWVAITGSITLLPLLLAGMNMTLIVGMDIIYALQDIEFDKRRGLHSLPVLLGAKGAQWVAQISHFVFLCLNVVLGFLCQRSLFYFLSPLLVFCLFFFFYRRVSQEIKKKQQLVHFEPLFFSCTLMISLCTLFFILLV